VVRSIRSQPQSVKKVSKLAGEDYGTLLKALAARARRDGPMFLHGMTKSFLSSLIFLYGSGESLEWLSNQPKTKLVYYTTLILGRLVL
jgi:hypothetical protein